MYWTPKRIGVTLDPVDRLERRIESKKGAEPGQQSFDQLPTSDGARYLIGDRPITGPGMRMEIQGSSATCARPHCSPLLTKTDDIHLSD
jgi:hypothetical protein